MPRAVRAWGGYKGNNFGEPKIEMNRRRVVTGGYAELVTGGYAEGAVDRPPFPGQKFRRLHRGRLDRGTPRIWRTDGCSIMVR
jgi:hypothetical protein